VISTRRASDVFATSALVSVWPASCDVHAKHVRVKRTVNVVLIPCVFRPHFNGQGLVACRPGYQAHISVSGVKRTLFRFTKSSATEQPTGVTSLMNDEPRYQEQKGQTHYND
jgi:hypothetical protein